MVGGQRQGEHRDGDLGGAVQDCQEGDKHQHGRDHLASPPSPRQMMKMNNIGDAVWRHEHQQASSRRLPGFNRIRNLSMQTTF